MANNRYYMQCPCGEQRYLGKSIGSGIYDSPTAEDLQDWMWEHLIDCHKDEWVGGEIFKVVTEYPKSE